MNKRFLYEEKLLILNKDCEPIITYQCMSVWSVKKVGKR